MDRELWYASGGPLLYDDTEIATNWYPAPYDILPLRAALLSQAYLTDVPVHNLEVARRMDIDGTPGTILKAGADSLPADSVITEDGTNITITGRNLLLSLTGAWNLGSATVLLAGVFSNAFRMPTGAGAGKIIESDADGDFSWVTHIVPPHNILSASHADSLTASAILGDILHGNITPVWARLAGNITTTKKFLVQTGTGAISAIPAWDTIVDGDVPATHSGSAHHAAVTVSAPISLSGQALSLVNNAVSPATVTAIDVGALANSDTVIPTSKAVTTAIGGAGHAAVTLSVAAEVLLGLSTQEIGLDTQAANLLFAGPVSGAVAAPTFRALVNADFPITLNPTFAGLGATLIVTSYTGPHALGGAAFPYGQLSILGSFNPAGPVIAFYIASDLTPGSAVGWAAYGIGFATTMRMVATKTHPVFAQAVFDPPVIVAASGATVTEATTVRIVSAPTAGISNYALNVATGASRFGALTASLPIVTNSDKVLASLAYTGATSFRKNLGLETDDSPTFAGIVIADAGTIGLGVGKGLIQFDDETTDFISFMNCYVGVGTVTPGQVLDVVGNIRATSAYPYLYLKSTAGYADTWDLLSYSDGVLYVQSSNYGNVAAFTRLGKAGIGTIAPTGKLQVETADISDVNLYSGAVNLVLMTTNSAVVGAGGAITLGGAYTGTTKYGFASIKGGLEVVGSSNGYLALFTTKTGVGSVEAIRINSDGKVGIGDPIPGELLDVAGNINLTGVLKVDDVQVVGNQGAHVVDADAGTIVAQFNTLLARLETHGLLASV